MWSTVALIALFVLVVVAIFRKKRTPQYTSESQLPSAQKVPEQIAIDIAAPRPIEEKVIEKPSIGRETEPHPIKNNEVARNDSKIPEIEAKIKAEIHRRQATTPEDIALLVASSVFDLDSHSETLAHEFIVEVYTRLRLQGQLVDQGPHKIPDWRPVRNMLESVLEASLGLLLHADENLDVVRSYMPMLLSKRRSLSIRDEYGDEDLQPWANFSSRFAVEKLKGVSSLKIYMEHFASDSDRSTVSHQGLADMFGGFTRMAIVILEFSGHREGSEPMTGVEYERMLQTQIEENFPTAHVSMTPATGDQGSDLIVDIDGKRIAIQAKYYQSAVGNAAVQEAFSGKGFYEADFAMVVCDSSFTRHAIELSGKLEVTLATTHNYIQMIEELADVKKALSL